jgi:hypothetical protein
MLVQARWPPVIIAAAHPDIIYEFAAALEIIRACSLHSIQRATIQAQHSMF